MKTYNWEGVNPDGYFLDRKSGSAGMPRSEERFSRNAETDLVCRLLLEKKNHSDKENAVMNENWLRVKEASRQLEWLATEDVKKQGKRQARRSDRSLAW